MNNDRFFGREYIAALKEHYPDLVSGSARANIDRVLHIGIVSKWLDNLGDVGVDASDRFQRASERPWRSQRSAWLSSGAGQSVRYAGVHYAYKGLINFKPAIELVLYSNLIWELQPRTIIEFGSLQGGSALWFSDQLDALSGGGEVHSFDLCDRCVSNRATHRRLHFHHADLRDLETLDEALFARLPHPWLVVDDAHANLHELVPFVAAFMERGDYYVIEDVFQYHPERVGRERAAFESDRLAAKCEELGFLVDTKYTDAFGLNVTTSPNGWLIKGPA